jgi:hypothetical protein
MNTLRYYVGKRSPAVVAWRRPQPFIHRTRHFGLLRGCRGVVLQLRKNLHTCSCSAETSACFQQQEAQRVRGHLLVTWEWCVGTGGAMGDLATAVAWMVMWSVPTKNETRRTASQTRCKQRAKRVPTAPRTIGHLKASVGVRCVRRRCKIQTSPNQGGDMSKTIKKDRCKNTWDRVRRTLHCTHSDDQTSIFAGDCGVLG